MDSSGEFADEELDFHLESTEHMSSGDDDTTSNRNLSSSCLYLEQRVRPNEYHIVW
jgi:hypothetical protein